MEKGIEIVNDYFNTDITTESRKPKIVEPRQVFFYCMANNTDYTLAKLGEMFGFTHRNVIYSKNKVKDIMFYDKKMREDVAALEYLIKEAYDQDRIKIVEETNILLDFKQFIFDEFPEINIEVLSDLDIRKYVVKSNLCG